MPGYVDKTQLSLLCSKQLTRSLICSMFCALIRHISLINHIFCVHYSTELYATQLLNIYSILIDTLLLKKLILAKKHMIVTVQLSRHITMVFVFLFESP